MPPPHPPQMRPTTPRTPRSRTRTPATPRNGVNSSIGPPQAPATPRLFGVKRSTNAPLGSSSEEENNSSIQKVSSGSSKRKKNEPNVRPVYIFLCLTTHSYLDNLLCHSC